MTWNEVMPLADLWDGEHIGIIVAGKSILVLKQGGNVFAYQDACPHLKTKLSEGELKQGVLKCRFHGWEFDAQSGQGINPCSAQLTKIPVQITGEKILVNLND